LPRTDSTSASQSLAVPYSSNSPLEEQCLFYNKALNSYFLTWRISHLRRNRLLRRCNQLTESWADAFDKETKLLEFQYSDSDGSWNHIQNESEIEGLELIEDINISGRVTAHRKQHERWRKLSEELKSESNNSLLK